MPSTNDPVLNLFIKSSKQDVASQFTYSDIFLASGLIPLADIFNTYIATITCQQSGKCSAAQGVEITTIGGVEFPSPEYTENAFWSNVGFVFALLMILTLLYPIANVIRALVQEKETKLKEGMMMMALRGDVHYWSWIFHFMCLFLPLSIILTIAGKPLFSHSNLVYIWFYFMLFFLSATSFAYLMSNFFNKALTAAIVGIVLFFGGYFIFIALVSGNFFDLIIIKLLAIYLLA